VFLRAIHRRYRDAVLCHELRTAPSGALPIDDSTDNSIDIIRPFLERFPFLRLIRHERNQCWTWSIRKAAIR
jgi:hypothetical protein